MKVWTSMPWMPVRIIRSITKHMHTKHTQHAYIYKAYPCKAYPFKDYAMHTKHTMAMHAFVCIITQDKTFINKLLKTRQSTYFKLSLSDV